MAHRSPSSSIRFKIERLSLQEKRGLHQWLESQIEVEAALDNDALPNLTAKNPTSANSAIVESCAYESKTYQLEKRRCGKKSCKCVGLDLRSTGHGPYWYMYWKESGKLKSRYVGKRPPWQNSSC
jgi:hypothetical protein